MYFVDTGKSKKKVNGRVDKLLVENEKQCQQNMAMPSVEYKLPLVWIDLEMTGRHMLLIVDRYAFRSFTVTWDFILFFCWYCSQLLWFNKAKIFNDPHILYHCLLFFNWRNQALASAVMIRSNSNC